MSTGRLTPHSDLNTQMAQCCKVSFFTKADLFVYMFVYTIGTLIVAIVYMPVHFIYAASVAITHFSFI